MLALLQSLTSVAQSDNSQTSHTASGWEKKSFKKKIDIIDLNPLNFQGTVYAVDESTLFIKGKLR